MSAQTERASLPVLHSTCAPSWRPKQPPNDVLAPLPRSNDSILAPRPLLLRHLLHHRGDLQQPTGAQRRTLERRSRASSPSKPPSQLEQPETIPYVLSLAQSRPSLPRLLLPPVSPTPPPPRDPPSSLPPARSEHATSPDLVLRRRVSEPPTYPGRTTTSRHPAPS